MATNNYSFKLMPSTSSTSRVSLPIFGRAIFLTGMFLASVPNENGIEMRIRSNASGIEGTFSQHQNNFTGDYSRPRSVDLESVLSNFYANLLAKQEPLGADFAKVLAENIWDMCGD